MARILTRLTLPMSNEKGDKVMQGLEDVGLIEIGPSIIRLTDKGSQYITELIRDKPDLVALMLIYAQILEASQQ